MEYISAQQAREKAESSISDNTKKQLDTIFIEINKAINEGKCSVFADIYATPQTINKLESLGYTAKACSDQREGSWTDIKW